MNSITQQAFETLEKQNQELKQTLEEAIKTALLIEGERNALVQVVDHLAEKLKETKCLNQTKCPGPNNT